VLPVVGMYSDDKIKRKLIESVKPVDSLIDEILKPRRPEVLYDASRHLVMAGGKRLRPFLTIKSCEIVGGNTRDAIPFAAAFEILHNFTLIHDDVMDNDAMRRGAQTVHTKWGIPMAIAAGDLLFAKVFEAMTIYAPKGMNAKRINNCIEIASTATTELCEGQVLDISFPNISEVTEDDYITMVGGKTSALFRACAEVGAIVGGGKKRQIKAMGQFAWDAGIAFQLMDDYLGATADEKTLGKPVGSDLREGKKTLIIIHALRKAKPRQKEKILAVLGNPSATKQEIDEINNLLKEIGSIDYTLKKADRYITTAKRHINVLPDSEAKSDLLALIYYFTNRQY
jgi:geranylgeranyl diphosphate synthase type I